MAEAPCADARAQMTTYIMRNGEPVDLRAKHGWPGSRAPCWPGHGRRRGGGMWGRALISRRAVFTNCRPWSTETCCGFTPPVRIGTVAIRVCYFHATAAQPKCSVIAAARRKPLYFRFSVIRELLCGDRVRSH
jgi:hypothetical protein